MWSRGKTQQCWAHGDEAGPGTVQADKTGTATDRWVRVGWLMLTDPQRCNEQVNPKEKLGVVLDLYHRIWQGQPVGPDDQVTSTDEKTSMQAGGTWW